MSIRPRIRIVKRGAAGLTVHDATYHTDDVIPAADQDFGGYRLQGLKRMDTVPVAADIGTDGLVLYEGLGDPTYSGGNGDTTTGVAANYPDAIKIALTSAGVIQKVRIKLAGNANYKLALYDDDGAAGEPATRLVDWGAFAGVSGVNNFDVADYEVAAAGNFWLGVLADATQGRYSTSAPLTSQRYYSRAYALGLEATWPNATDSHAETNNLYQQLGLAVTVRRLYLNVNDTIVYFATDG